MPPFTFGPLIDAPPSHPDTIVTTLDYCKNYLQSLGMNTVHITLDMQLYMVAIQVKWSDPEKWATLVIHPGEMHCVMSFLGCIGKLMRGSDWSSIQWFDGYIKWEELATSYACFTYGMHSLVE